MQYNRIHNFSAGPAALPLPVLEKARDEMVNYMGSGMSVMEMSHRSKEFMATLDRARDGLRRVFSIPAGYSILFLTGGASFQFAMVPVNLALPGKPVEVVHTGVWVKKAINELKKLAEHKVIWDGEKEKFTRVPKLSEIKYSKDASYVHICSNNTIYGTQYSEFPDTGSTPLVADMSSDILSRPVDVSKFGLIFAGAQKNIGPSGVTVVIIRDDLAERCSEKVTTMMQYRTHIKEGSMYNTPPTFGIYMVALVMEWIESVGGIPELQKRNDKKAALLYEAIDASKLFYCPVQKESRSKMNVVFRVKDNNEPLEEKFVSESKKAGLNGLKGHRSAGGLRASIYNACPIESVQALVDFMKEFEKKNG